MAVIEGKNIGFSSVGRSDKNYREWGVSYAVQELEIKWGRNRIYDPASFRRAYAGKFIPSYLMYTTQFLKDLKIGSQHLKVMVMNPFTQPLLAQMEDM